MLFNNNIKFKVSILDTDKNRIEKDLCVESLELSDSMYENILKELKNVYRETSISRISYISIDIHDSYRRIAKLVTVNIVSLILLVYIIKFCINKQLFNVQILVTGSLAIFLLIYTVCFNRLNYLLEFNKHFINNSDRIIDRLNNLINVN